MPLEVKDVFWTETEQYMVVNIPLKGASAKNVDIFSTNYYIKVSYPPYFYELALYEEVDDENSKATISKEQVAFHLQKKVAGIWGQLKSLQQKDKEFMKNLRVKALEYKQTKEQEKTKERNIKKNQEKKFSVKEQMKIDDVEISNVKKLKEEEGKAISKDIAKWKNNHNESRLEDHACNNKENQKEFVESENKISLEKTQIKKCEKVSEENKVEEKEKEKKSIPMPRATGSIEVSFTPRLLATPARESKLPEEECWLSKVAEFNRMKKTDNIDATDIEETNPMWLKDKGNEFYKKGNIVAAINAYSSALILDSKIPMIYANRAACHLSLKQYKECIQDCTCALELYEPRVPANAASRCRALTRRGSAYFEIEDYVNALLDYEEAIKLDPKNEGLQKDATKIRNVIQGDE